jgi:pimeloyl-ACP methyl ester carboxylesterase
MKRFNPLLLALFISGVQLISSCKSEPVTSIDSFDGVRLNFDNEGKGDISLVLVHGWANNRSIWDDQVSHFSEKYQVIALDLPGFGESGNNRNEWSMSAYGKDITSIILELNLKNVVLVGFSLGGPIIIESYKNTPDQIIGLVLVDAIQDVESKITPPMAHYIDSVMMDIVNNITKEKFVKGGFVKKNIESSFQRIVSILDGASHIGWEETLAEVKRWQNEDCTYSIKDVKVPIIAINSEIRPTNVEAFRRYAPGFKVKIVKDVGHLIMWDSPEEFNRLLEESIQEFIVE